MSLSSGSFTRRTNERLYSRRLADLWSAEVDRLVCSRARYKSPRESACILKSRPCPANKEKQRFYRGYIFNTSYKYFFFFLKTEQTHFRDINFNKIAVTAPPYETVTVSAASLCPHSVGYLPSVKWQRAETNKCSKYSKLTARSVDYLE